MKFILLHGAYSTPESNWFPWLSYELKKLGHEVFIPEFPTPENQTLMNWKKVFKPYLEELDGETILIGHSLGAVFILRILEELKTKVKVAFLVAGFIEKLGIEKFDSINSSFLKKGFDWGKIKSHCQKLVIISAKDDPYVPIVQSDLLSQNLSSENIIFSKAGHFNIDSGYKKFSKLLKFIKQNI